MKKKVLLVLTIMVFMLLGLPQAQAQRIDELTPSNDFLETLYLAYSFYLDEAFEVYLDAQEVVSVKSTCEDSADIQHFATEKIKAFKAYASQPKETFGEQVSVWSESLPEELFSALVKAENLRAGKQNNLCSNSSPFCTDNGLYEFPAGVNAGVGEPGPYYSCLGTRPNPAWYYMRILDPGDMDIYMYSTPKVDIDFCCWGPFDDPFSPCPDGLKRNKVVDCSYSTNWEETCKIRDAQTGDYFILLITNYSNRTCNINFSKVAGDATTDCSILPPLVSYDNPVCAGQDLQFYANGSSGDAFHWFFMDGTWTSNEQNPVRTNVTRDMSGTYGCVITRDGQQSDTTYLEVVISEGDYQYIQYDGCAPYIWNGVEYTENGLYTLSWTTLTGCDSIVDLDLTLNYTPNFEIIGDHWPIGGSETYISVNEYAITLDNPNTRIDTVLWQVDCENWRLVPHGQGESCTLYIYSFLEEPVMLHATAYNSCGTIPQDFFIQTSYFGVEETNENQIFTVSPNPTDGNLVLHFGDLEGWTEILVFNSLGQKLDDFSIDASTCKETTYTMPSFNNGVYYLMMQYKGKAHVRKVALMR